MSAEESAEKPFWGSELDSRDLRDAVRARWRYPHESLARLKKLAEEGAPVAMVYVGRYYQNGTGTERDFRQAEAWFQRAIASGNVMGSYALGHLYVKQRRFLDARRAYEAAVDKDYPPAMSHLGMLYLYGTGGPRDVARAKLLLEEATARGHMFGMYGLSLLLTGVPLTQGEWLRGVWLRIRVNVEGVIVLCVEGSDSKRWQ